MREEQIFVFLFFFGNSVPPLPCHFLVSQMSERTNFKKKDHVSIVLLKVQCQLCSAKFVLYNCTVGPCGLP
jgi:hypothetical protein